MSLFRVAGAAGSATRRRALPCASFSASAVFRPEPSQLGSFLDTGSRRIFNEEHDAFRQTCRAFFAEHIVPSHSAWEKRGWIDREAWTAAGDVGMLGVSCPEEYGGLGADFMYTAITWEEQNYAKGSPSGPGFSLHSDIVMPYIIRVGSEEQKQRLLPAMCKGEAISAIAMTEPGAGSDLQGIRTNAVARPGGGWTLNGSKTYITNGYLSDVVIVVARTNPDVPAAHGTSLFLVETAKHGGKGFSKGTPLNKMGMKAQDTCELFFDDVQLDETALLGELNKGFYYLMEELPQERLMIGSQAQTMAEAAFEEARTWCNERKAFGKSLFDGQQVVRHKLANMKTLLCQNRAFVDQCLELHAARRLDSVTASMVKTISTELCSKICDDAVQLHGGAGYMSEYPVARNLVDARVARIYGGANEIMTELVARTCKIR